MVEANATTNLSEINADFVRLWQPAKVNHEDIRNIFVDQNQVTEPVIVQTTIGDEIETTLVYDAPTNQQIPALKGLLDYLSQNPYGTINKYFTVHRKNQAVFQGDNHSFTRKLTQNNQKTQQCVFEGDTHVLQRRVSKSVQNMRMSIEQNAPVLIQKMHLNKNITRPIHIEQFSPVIIQRTHVHNKISRPIYIFSQ